MQLITENNSFFGQRVPFSGVTLLPLDVQLTDYDDKVIYAALSPYLLPGTSILDLGCGSQSELPKALLQRGCSYHGLDHDLDALQVKEYGLAQSTNWKLTHGNMVDLKQFPDNSFDIVLMKSALLHVPPSKHCLVVQELYRIAARAVFVQEISWSRMGNSEEHRLFASFRDASARLLMSHNKEGHMDVKLPAIITKALPDIISEIIRVDDRPPGRYAPELLPVSMNALHCATFCYDQDDAQRVVSAIENMVEYLENPEVEFIPPAFLVAHIPKITI